MDFENPLHEFIMMGRIAEEVDVFGKKVRMRVLNAGQRRDILQETGHMDGVTRVHQMQIATLARAIMSIDGIRLEYKPEKADEPITIEKTIEQTKKYLVQAQQPVIDHLYDKYNELMEKQSQQVEELKKKLVKPGPEPSGKLEKSQVSTESST